jgi:hypothetical protein
LDSVSATNLSAVRQHQVIFNRQEPAIDRAIEAALASIALMDSMQGGTVSFDAEILK